MADADPVTARQIRAIHVAARAADLDDDAYRAMLRARHGVRSSRDLTRAQATDLLRALGVPLRRPPTPYRDPRLPRRRPEHTPPGVTALPSPRQLRLIDDLAGRVRWRADDGYERWLHSRMGLRRVATSMQAARVIEGLRAMAGRQ